MDTKHQNFISAAVYVYNAESSIAGFLETLYAVLNENFINFEIICVLDDSPDGSRTVIENLAGGFENCMLSVINMGGYHGVEAAMQAGTDLAVGDFVFEFDRCPADYPPDLIIRAYERLLEGYDIVSCGGGRSGAASKIFYSVYNRYSGTKYNLKSESFRIISRRAINRVQSMSINRPYRKAQYASCGLKSDYIAYSPVRKNKNPAQPLKNPHDTALTSLILFTDVAYKITLCLTFIMMASAMAAAVYVLAVYLLGSPAEGYTTMMLFMSGVFFALFAVLSVIIKYLSVIAGLVFNKQRYIIESIEKITKAGK